MRAFVAWVLVAACAAWVALRVLGLERGFPLVPLVAYTPFAAAGAVVVVVLVLLLRQRVAAVVGAVLAVVLVAIVAPRAFGGPSSPAGAPGPRVVVATVNMHLGSGSAADLVSVVRRSRVSVLAVQELSPGLAAELDALGLDELLPHRSLQPGEGAAGIGLYANVPLEALPLGGERYNPLVLARVSVEGAGPVEVASVHPPPPTRYHLPGWHSDLAALPRATPGDAVRILAGDFNATLDHAELRDVLASGYVDAAAEVGAGLSHTWPRSWRVWPPPVTIDHVLADERVGVRGVSVHTIGGTDHRAVVAELVLPR